MGTAVVTRVEANVVVAAKRLAAAKAEHDRMRDRMIDAVRTAYHDGVSEYRLADIAGVSRGTIRAWLGK